MSETITVNCPTCGKTVVWGEISPFRPFCSKRCQLIDLAGLIRRGQRRIRHHMQMSDAA